MRNNAAKKLLSIILAITVIAGLIPFTSVTHTKAAEEILSTDDFQYRIESDNTINIIKCLNTTDEEITIPEKINGYLVVKICYNTSTSFFSSDNTVTKRLNIPKYVTSIDLSGLKNNPLEFINVDADNSSYASDEKGLLYNKDFTQLKFCPNALQADEFIIPESVKSYDPFNLIFAGCHSIKRIVFPKSAKSICSNFSNCTSLESIQFPDEIYNTSFEFKKCTSLKSVDLSNVRTLNLAYDVFSGCTSLESVTLNNTFTRIGSQAFYNCSSLKEIDLLNAEAAIAEMAFSGCTSLERVLGANNIKTVGFDAFSGCKSLTQISFGESLLGIGDKAFINCTKLTDISLPSTAVGIGDNAFKNTALINDTSRYENGALYIGKCLIATQPDITSLSVKSDTLTIGGSAFAERKSLTDVTLPEGLVKIGSESFKNCTALESITIPNTVVYISANVFQGSGIKEITIPDSVKQIGPYCFCTPSLKSVNLPRSLTEINSVLFSGTSLTTVSIPDSVLKIRNGAFSGCKLLETVIIPESVTSIEEYAFNSCSAIKSITLPSELSELKHGVFSSCTSLEKIDIPANIKEIQNNTFLNCTSLKEVNLPNGLTKIGDSAFVGCESLTSIAIPKSVKSFGTSVFNNYLKTVYFEGSEEEWNAITFGANNTPLEQAEIIFNSTGATVPDEPKDSITWSFDSSDGHLFLSGSGDMLEREKTSDYEWYGFRSSIKSLTIGEGVTSVGANAFTGFVNLGEIIVGKDVKKIGDNAFAGCAKLSLISFVGEPSEISSSAFVGCNKRMTVIGENDLGKAFAQSNGFNYNPISFDSEKKVLNFGNKLTIYKDLPYTFIVYYVVKYSQSEYLHFDKLIFDGVIGDTISMDNVDKSAEYLTLNNLYVSLKSTDGEQISFARMLELLEDGEYDAFKYVVKDDKNPEQEEKPKPEKKDFFEKIAEGLENLYTNALKTLSKVANFFRKLFK